jgi:zinc transport system ATP-binding protein
MSEKVLEFKQVTFAYEQQIVLESVSLAVESGEFLAIVGPNGSGKSTLVKLAIGLLRPQSGEVYLFGKPANHPDSRQRIGYVSQRANRFQLGFPATVREVVASGLCGRIGLFRRLKRQDWQRVEEVIEQVGLAPLMNQNIGSLSGGQQQRALIARALVRRPELLILDEPTVGVDQRSTEQFYELLSDLHQKEKMSLMMVTHDIGVMSSYVDRVACLNRKLYFHGRSYEFKQKQQEILLAAYGYDIQLIHHNHEQH